jgi:hypothetical protein
MSMQPQPQSQSQSQSQSQPQPQPQPQQRARTWLELANDPTCPNARHARACIEERVAVYTTYSLLLECLFATLPTRPHLPDETRAAAIRRLLMDVDK